MPQAKKSSVQTPIIMLTAARTEEMDKVLGLELGADDYMTKPFSSQELMARIKAVLRRSQDSNSLQNQLQFGDMTIDFKKHEVTQNGKLVPLTPLEFRLLRFLINNQTSRLKR